MVALLAVTSVLAPVLEEVVFRGFLLTTLTKWCWCSVETRTFARADFTLSCCSLRMPVPGAVVLSSVAFGAAHLTPRDFPQLVALGLVLGFAYVRSRNLLTPMLVHGAWNGGVLIVLTMLAAQGVDLRAVLDS